MSSFSARKHIINSGSIVSISTTFGSLNLFSINFRLSDTYRNSLATATYISSKLFPNYINVLIIAFHILKVNFLAISTISNCNFRKFLKLRLWHRCSPNLWPETRILLINHLLKRISFPNLYWPSPTQDVFLLIKSTLPQLTCLYMHWIM